MTLTNGWTRYRDIPYSATGGYVTDGIRTGIGLLHAVPAGERAALCGAVCAVISDHPYPQAGSVCVVCARRARDIDS